MEKQNPPPYAAANPAAPPGFIHGPPQPQPPPPQLTTTHVTVASVAPAVVGVQLGSKTQFITCPSCHHQVNTTVESVANSKTHLFALLLCCCICWPCVCLPYCMDSCQTQKHTCPNCGSFIGDYQN